MPSPKIGEEVQDKEKRKKKKKNIFKRKKDDMGNKGRRGKGPKPMDRPKVDDAPVIKPINSNLSSKVRWALENQDKLNEQRFQGSTKPLGNIKPIE